MTYDQWKTESGYDEREECCSDQSEASRAWMQNFTSRDQAALRLKVLDYLDRDNVFGDHFSEYEILQIMTLLGRPWEDRA